MSKSKEQIISGCSDKHDRDLMTKYFEERDKKRRPITIAMWIATLLAATGIIGIQFNEYFVISFMFVFPFLFYAMFKNFSSVWLI